MKILLNNIGKKYNKQWIFKNLDYTFEEAGTYAILGNNGSGKSTLLQCIIGAIQLSAGTVQYSINDEVIASDKVYKNISFASPYMELIEEMTLLEMLHFHQKFKPFYSNIDVAESIRVIGLEKAENKQIGNFSSGMKQRLKLGLAFFSQSHIICLDEPISNLDVDGITLYKNLIQNFTLKRTLIISSNDEEEYAVCKNRILVNDYKLS